VVTMQVGDKNTIQLAGIKGCAQQLMLCPFATVK
jgi:hypothetical protein